MWDLTTADIHTFYVVAGSSVLLVHNAPVYCRASNEKGVLADGRSGEILAKQYPTSQIHPQFEIYTPRGVREVDCALEDGKGDAFCLR